MERIKKLSESTMRIQAVLGKLENLYQPFERRSLQDIDIWEDSLDYVTN